MSRHSAASIDLDAQRINLADQFRQAATAARNSTALQTILKQAYQANAEGLISDADAQATHEAAATRRAALATEARTAPAERPRWKPRKPCRSPDRAKSDARARKLARSRDIPDTIAQEYNTKELAALAIIIADIRATGACGLCIDEIAARSGSSRSTVKRAQRRASFLGHLNVKERRIPGRKNLTNVVTLVSLEWTAFIKWQSIGVHRRTTTGTPRKTYAEKGTRQPSPPTTIASQRPFEALTKHQRADLLRGLIRTAFG